MERASVNTANGFVNQSVNVLYIALFKHPHFFKLDNKINFYEPKDFNHTKLSFYKTFSWLRKVIKKENPDSILVYNKFFGAIVVLALIATKYRVFISERFSPFYPWPAKIKIFNKVAFKLNPPVGVMAQTKIAAQVQKKYYHKKVSIKVIPNSLRKVKLYPELLREEVILGVGRINEFNKGFDRLLSAFSMIENKQWKLKLIGNINGIDALRNQAKELGIEKRMQFVEPTNAIDEVFAKAGIFVIPSRSEGFPNALCEAMATGLPCISFDFIAGPRDIITNTVDGFIIEDGNIELLAKKINELIGNQPLRHEIGQSAMEIRKRLEQNKISKQVLDFISTR